MLSAKRKFGLVTGAGGLLGPQHSIALLEIGYNIILTDINIKKIRKIKKDLNKQFPNSKIFALKMDVTSLKSVMKIRNFIYKQKLELKTLINNASIDSKVNSSGKLTSSSKFENIKLNDWNNHLNVGITGAMICSQVFGQIMVHNKSGGIILNIASDLSVIAPNHSIYKKGEFKPVMYSVIKHAIIGLTKYLSTYWNKKNIRCNALSPGPVYNNQSKSFINKLKKQIPLGKLASKNEYNEAIKFLCSESSKYMTGQNIIIDGGRSVW